MSVPTADTMVGWVRYHLQDTDTNDQGLADSQIYIELNDAYQDFCAAFPDLLVTQVGTITLAASTYSYTLTTTVDVRDLTAATLTSTKQAIERCNIEEMLGILNSITGNVSPRSWAARRSSTDIKNWTIYILPTPTGAAASDTITFFGHLQPTDLTSGATPLLGSAECRWVARIAAARGAVKLGRTADYINGLWRDLPQQVQNEMRVVEGAKRPYATPNEQVT